MLALSSVKKQAAGAIMLQNFIVTTNHMLFLAIDKELCTSNTLFNKNCTNPGKVLPKARVMNDNSQLYLSTYQSLMMPSFR